MASHLRVFHEPELTCFDAPPANVRMRLGDLLPLLEAARRADYTWLADFLDDEVRITADLYDVLREFDGYRPSA